MTVLVCRLKIFVKVIKTNKSFFEERQGVMNRFFETLLFAVLMVCFIGCASGEKQTVIGGIPFQEAGYSKKKDPAPVASPSKAPKKKEPNKDKDKKITISYPTWIEDGILGGGAGYGETSKAHWAFGYVEGEKYFSLSDRVKLGGAFVFEKFDGATSPPQSFDFKGESIVVGPTVLFDRPGKTVGSQTKVRLLAGLREDEGKDKSGYKMEQDTILLRWDVQHFIYRNDDVRWFRKVALYARGYISPEEWRKKDASFLIGAARVPLPESVDPPEDKTMSFLGAEFVLFHLGKGLKDVNVAANVEAQLINADASSRGSFGVLVKFLGERLSLGYQYTVGHGSPDIHGPSLNFFEYTFGGKKDKKKDTKRKK